MNPSTRDNSRLLSDVDLRTIAYGTPVAERPLSLEILRGVRDAQDSRSYKIGFEEGYNQAMMEVKKCQR